MTTNETEAIKTGTHKRSKAERTAEEAHVMQALCYAQAGVGLCAVDAMRLNAGCLSFGIRDIAMRTLLDFDRIRPTLMRLKRKGLLAKLGTNWSVA